MYENGNKKLFEDVNNEIDSIRLVEKYYSKNGIDFKERAEAFSIRIYFVIIQKQDNQNVYCEINSLSHNAKFLNKDKAVEWNFLGQYKDRISHIRLIDKKDMIYTIWDMFEIINNKNNIDIINNLKFEIEVKPKPKTRGGYTSQQRLALFFSKKGNWGKIWKYDDLRSAMAKEGLAMQGRGIEGERPREFRYILGYPFITNETDKNIKDGHCIVRYPFPTLPRNERRNPNVNLEKSDWSELFNILKKDIKRLRCFECGLFEDEVNKTNQRTKFQKSHLESFLTSNSGDASKDNIVAICQHCNGKQGNTYNYEKNTGKKIYNYVEIIKKTNKYEKLRVLEFLVSTLETHEVIKIIEKSKLEIKTGNG